MSSSTKPTDPAAVRLALLLAYPLLAHAAAATAHGWLAALAALDLVLVLLLDTLARRRAWAWALLALSLAGLAWLARSPHALLPLLVAPPVFVAAAGWMFARTLRGGRIPLVGRIAAAMEGTSWEALEPDVRRYTLRVTWGWAILLFALAIADVAMALLASPVNWSWFANFGDYAVIGGFMLAEFVYRQWRFPGRGNGFAGFVRGLASLGPAFWREALR